MVNNKKVSLVIPCYNEEANLQKGVLDKFGNFTKDDNRFHEVLIVDDGSQDTTKKMIRDKYLKQFPKFLLIENTHKGKAFAVMSGIQKATGEYVFFSDIDLATPIEEGDKLIQAVEEGYDIAIGSRNPNRKGAPLSRKVLARGFIMIRDFFIGLRGIRDTQCGFKIFNRTAALDIINRLQVFKLHHAIRGPSVSAGFDLEFLFIARKLGYTIKEVPVVWRHVETRNVNFLKDALETLGDIAKIKYYDFKGNYDKK